jgi:hypothetical protein
MMVSILLWMYIIMRYVALSSVHHVLSPIQKTKSKKYISCFLLFCHVVYARLAQLVRAFA